MRPAVFLDRDGTLIEEVNYLVDPQDVRLVAGAGEAICRLREAGFACVVITNQSAIARGMLTEAGLEAIHAEMSRQLAEAGARLDGVYFAPHAPLGSDRRIVEHPDRKPGPGMLLRAAREMTLDLGASWMVGDLISDLLAGRNAGVRGTILVRTGYGTTVDPADDAVDHVAENLAEAARIVLGAASGKEIP